MRVNLKRFILFAIGFLLVSSFSFSVYADTLDSESNKFFTNNNINVYYTLYFHILLSNWVNFISNI